MRYVSLLSTLSALLVTASMAHAGDTNAAKTKQQTAPTSKQIKILGQSSSPQSEQLKYQIPSDIILGNAKAPVTIVEYSSLTCPHCAHFINDLLPTIKKKYIDTGKVKFISRDFPLDGTALKAAKLPHCAGKDRYYDFLKVLFKTQDSWARQDNFQELLGNIARLGGMPADEFNKCMDNKDLELQIADTRLQAAEHLGIKSTPTFFINGIELKGAGSIPAFEEALNKALDPNHTATPAQPEAAEKQPVAHGKK
ncbi:MAG: DsbA family protein [Alphaproteobacteria bacterium]|nr:DsbA family protein [Alphaproteobacteria bacterium]